MFTDYISSYSGLKEKRKEMKAQNNTTNCNWRLCFPRNKLWSMQNNLRLVLASQHSPHWARRVVFLVSPSETHAESWSRTLRHTQILFFLSSICFCFLTNWPDFPYIFFLYCGWTAWQLAGITSSAPHRSTAVAIHVLHSCWGRLGCPYCPHTNKLSNTSFMCICTLHVARGR